MIVWTYSLGSGSGLVEVNLSVTKVAIWLLSQLFIFKYEAKFNYIFIFSSRNIIFILMYKIFKVICQCSKVTGLVKCLFKLIYMFITCLLHSPNRRSAVWWGGVLQKGVESEWVTASLRLTGRVWWPRPTRRSFIFSPVLLERYSNTITHNSHQRRFKLTARVYF